MQLGVLSLGDHMPDPHTGAQSTPAERHWQIVEMAMQAESLDYDLVAVGEHHLCEYIVSAPPVVLGAIAARTSRIRLGTGTTLVPTLDPVRVAEDYATVDVISNGRVELVAGRGVIARTYRDMGYDADRSRELMEEGLELILALWSGEDVTVKPRFRPALENVTLHPRPVQRPHPPVWIGGGFSEESADLAARLGLPLMLPSILMPPDQFAPLVERYREKFVERGHGGPSVGAVTHTHVGPDTRSARERWQPYYAQYLRWVGGVLLPWGFDRPPQPAPAMAMLDDFDLTCETGAPVCGDAEAVLDRMARFCEAIRLDTYLLHMDPGALPKPLLLDSLERFAESVAPALRKL